MGEGVREKGHGSMGMQEGVWELGYGSWDTGAGV